MKSHIVRLQTCTSVSARIACVVLLTALFSAAPFHTAWAQTAPTLGAAQSFAVLGATTVTNTGPTVITGDLGVFPGTAITGFPPGNVVGATHAADAVALQAQSDTTAAYLNLAGQTCPASHTFGVPTDLSGMTLSPGVYCFASSAGLTGTLTLDGLGSSNAVWIFQIGSTLITGSSSTVQIINGGQPCNVFWQVGSSATLNTTTTFIGNILALTSIALQTKAELSGRALARNGAVTLDSNLINATACAAPQPNVPLRPSLGKAFSPNPITAGGTSTLTITLTNPDATVASNATVTDTLPSGVVVSGVASTTCGGSVTSNASSVTLTGGSIPAGGSCAVTVNVTAANAGSFTNTLAAGALQTSNGSNAAPAAATLIALLPTANAPGLSLTKTPNLTTYTFVGQVVVYTYVVTNIGNTTLTGPFTVTDDKLGSFTCGPSTAVLAPGASLTCTNSHTIVASDLGNLVLPTNVTATINTGSWLAFVNSTQDTLITGAGLAGVPNGTYACWCIQDHVARDLHNEQAKLYSTIGDSLPTPLPNPAVWNKVNYTLNHKIRGAGKSNLAFLKDVQTAIWVAVGEPNPEFGISKEAQQMIDAANANPDFVPGAGDIVAVIISSDGILPLPQIRPGEVQESVCEVKPLKSIVNKATVRNAVVTSGQVQATVKQVR